MEVTLKIKLECPNCQSKKFKKTGSTGVYTCQKCGGIYGLDKFEIIKEIW
jgi:ribosomal protein L37AE/L43A